jgi:phosphatidylserine/phosphatidylglycerophosphate/cardiolipin synthase-like enzyme
VVVDGQVAFVGGMDLTTFQGDRWDVPGHPLRAGPNWHDVQVRLEGEAVADVEHNFRQRWGAVTGDDTLPHRAPAFDPAWQTPVQIVRTIPRHVYSFAPHGEFGIHHAYTRALRGARRLIYLENQYLWSPDIMDALVAAMRSAPADFRIVLVLPAQAYSGKYDNDRHVERLREVDAGRGIVSVYCPYAYGPTAGVRPFTYRPIYVHAKVAIVDDEWLTVGSANLNNRGLITDSEIAAIVHAPDLAREMRLSLWAEHLNLPREEVAAADPVALIDHEWTRRAEENAEIVQRADRPLRCALHRYEIGRMPGAWFLEEAEALTFEH